jgi:glyoxylase-like metal-dependent hydrolase (beta-lactamase superfamily II)
MIHFRGAFMLARFKPDREPAHSTLFSRRNFVAGTSCFGAYYALAKLIPLPAMAAKIAGDSRISQTPVADKGFASVRKVGDGLYATISDVSKGIQTICNGGFLVGKEGALLLEGYASPPGAAFQMDALRMVSQAPVKAALDTHHHYDHSLGNSFYGANGISIWAHSGVSQRLLESYGPFQGADKATALAPFERAVKEAKTEVARQHREGYLGYMINIYNLANARVLALPNHPLDPAKLPMRVDLGGLTAQIEHYPGHSGTDLIVRVPGQNVVYTGDLHFDHLYPVTFDEQASVSGWRQTLKTFASWDKDTIFVPGHGQICGQDSIALFRALFDDIEEQAQKLHQAGVPAAEAIDRYEVPEKFKSVVIFAWDLTLAPTIAKLYAEWGAR